MHNKIGYVRERIVPSVFEFHIFITVSKMAPHTVLSRMIVLSAGHLKYICCFLLFRFLWAMQSEFCVLKTCCVGAPEKYSLV